MSTRSFIHLVHSARALLLVALCGIVAGGAVADRGGDRSRGGSGGRDWSRSSSGSTVNQSRQTDRSSGGSHSWRGSGSDRPGSFGRSNPGFGSQRASGGTSRDGQRRNDGRNNHESPIQVPAGQKPAGQWRPSQRPDDIRSQPGDRPGSQDNHRQFPGFDTRPPAVGSDHRFDRPQVRVPDHGRDNSYHQSRDYKPPTHHGSFYYYPARPSFKPMHYGHWVFDNRDPRFCRRSVYFHFGLFPYVQVARVHTAPYIVVSYRSGPVAVDVGGYYLAKQATTGLDNALADIRSAWLDGRLDLIKSHVNSDQQIAVLLDGKYDYSVDPDDYVQMTSDAIDQMETASFTWESTRQRIDGAYTAFGKHVYDDPSGATKTVYASYTLRKIGGSFAIVEVGSSTSPLN